MSQLVNLRQIAAFKAVMENGTVVRAAEVLHISQPAISKHIAHLEADSGLLLFDRVKGRLVPTEQATLLYDEIDRIMGGLRQVANAVEAIRRQKQGRIAVGLIRSLAGSVIKRSSVSFLAENPDVFLSIQALSTHVIVDRLVSRQIDIGLLSAGIDHPFVTREPLMQHPLVCIMPIDHPLTAKKSIEPQDLEQIPFVTFQRDVLIGHRITEMLETYKINVRSVVVTNLGPTVCEFVAAGLGVALVHPLMASGHEHELAVRRFEPDVLFHFQLCRPADSKNARLIETFAQEVRNTATEISQEIIKLC